MTIRILSNLPIRLSPFFLLIVFLIACGGNDVEPTARPIAPRPNPTATHAPSSVKVNVPPTSQARAIPTASVSMNICPFTGLPLNGVSLAQRRPLLIKIGNSPPERPQSGLAQADIVVEHLTEGAITRFAAIFYCTDANDIGPIRSARLIDLELVPMFNAIFVHVGGSEPVRQMIAESAIAPDDFDDYGRAPIFREIETRKRPFNRYTSTQEMYDLAAKKGRLTNISVPAFQFTSNVPSGGHTGNQVTVPYRPNLSDAVFTYDGQSKLYRRSIGTTPHVDVDTNQPLTAANVIILYAPHETTTIVEDSLGSRSIQITISGSGSAMILREGQVFDVTWSRSDPHALWQFTASNGQAISLKPGNTWIEVVPPEMKVKVE